MSIPASLERALQLHRRHFLQSAGLLAVTLQAQTPASGPYRDPDFHQIDSWIVIHQDNTATFYVGKTDPGQGTGTNFRQLMCDELDLPFERTTCIMGSTDITVDQIGSGGSTALERDSWPMRRVAAEARRILLEMAADRFHVPVSSLSVRDGVITAPGHRITYGELIGGRKFNVALSGANVNTIQGQARTKSVPELRYTGQSLQRDDIPSKVDGTHKWSADVKLPGMLHARNIKPPFACAQLLSVDESSVRGLPGLVKVMRKGNYLAVVCEREEQAIQAARQLKATWQKPEKPPFPSSENLFSYMRSVTPVDSKTTTTGTPEEAFASAAKVITAEYEIPFQGHTAFAPAHATADPSGGLMTIYSNDMKSYGMRRCVATFLGMPQDRVRVVWLHGPQSYGRTAAEDAACEAAWLAKELGRPVRMQWMRDEETAWDTKGPAFTVSARAALNAQGQLSAYEYDARSCDYNHVGYNEPQTVLVAQLMGIRKATPATGSAALPSEVYAIPHRRMTASVVSLPNIWETPLRCGNLRDPNGPQATFASESFIDEIAAAQRQDPLHFRLRLLRGASQDDSGHRRARSIAVLEAAAQAYGWQPRPSPGPRGKGDVLTGRGVAYSFRGLSIIAQIAEVEVHRQTGRVWAKRIVCAHDCGLIVNPESLRRTLECGTLYGLSRALHEEVQFDEQRVTSVDWLSHPSLRHVDVPERLDIVMVNGDPNPQRPDLPPYGAGEAVLKPTLAALANAIFDATGVRIRRIPLRPARVLAALQSAGLA